MAEATKKVEIPSEQLKQVVNPWLLGADPEFFVVNPPRLVSNADPYSVNSIEDAGIIGHDHGGRVWELRPAPHQSAYGLMTNIWKLLNSKALSKVENFKWKSGGCEDHQGGLDTIGGHVHFGFRTFKDGGLRVMADTTQALEHLEILPSTESRRRRDINPDYGDLYGTRNSNGHIEYRAPVSWLDKPGQTLAVLTIYKLAAALPESMEWTTSAKIKANFEDWLAAMSTRDVDGYILQRLLEKRSLKDLQADPGSNFMPLWRKGDKLWEK